MDKVEVKEERALQTTDNASARVLSVMNQVGATEMLSLRKVDPINDGFSIMDDSHAPAKNSDDKQGDSNDKAGRTPPALSNDFRPDPATGKYFPGARVIDQDGTIHNGNQKGRFQ